jgi:uncharacterized membrane protein
VNETEAATTDRAGAFLASLDEVPRESSTRSATWIRVGIVLQVAGAAAAILAVILSQSSNNPLDQFTLISLGIAGIVLAIIGVGLTLRYSLTQFLRFWMLRLSYEQQR